jgi:hypothetical protein
LTFTFISHFINEFIIFRQNKKKIKQTEWEYTKWQEEPLLITAPTINWRFSGYMKFYASYQVQCWQTFFVSEIANFL